MSVADKRKNFPRFSRMPIGFDEFPSRSIAYYKKFIIRMTREKRPDNPSSRRECRNYRSTRNLFMTHQHTNGGLMAWIMKSGNALITNVRTSHTKRGSKLNFAKFNPSNSVTRPCGTVKISRFGFDWLNSFAEFLSINLICI